MSASLLCLFLLGVLTLVSSQPSDGGAPPSSPMVSGISAHQGFLRSKRANRYLLEEILQGDLERECYEERCTYEEAREFFEDTTKTIGFWTVYYDGDQCEPNPCLHGGNCTDKVGGFSCMCPTPLYGTTCELGLPEDLQGRPPSSPQITLPEMFECPTDGPTACHQLCTASYYSFKCSCMPGFKLQSDGRSCLPDIRFPCGMHSDSAQCRHGNCPWQVSLQNKRGVEVCSGVVLGRRSVLTAAHCLIQDSGLDLRPSNFFVVPDNKKQLFQVRALYLHNRFHPDRHDNDLVLLELASPLPFGPALIHLCLPTKDFCENILMQPGKVGVTNHWSQDRLLDQDLAYVTLSECRKMMNVSYNLSNKMFCMMRQNEEVGEQSGVSANMHGDIRNPHVALGDQHGSQRQRDSLRRRNGNQRSQNGPLRNGNLSHGFGATLENSNEAREIQQRNQNQTFQNQGVALRKQTEDSGPFQRHTANTSQIQTQNQTQNDTESFTGTSPTQNPGKSRSGEEVRLHGGLLPGSPVATVEEGTAFLTGLLISNNRNDGNGAVFIKLSRYLNWIRQRLEVVENSMTPQVNLYPDRR